MQTIKTIIVVALLLTVCYGAYKAMNTEVEMPADLNVWAEKTGNDVLPDFNIPPITPNDNISQSIPVGTRSDSSLPAFPLTDPLPNSIGAGAQLNPGTPENPAPLLGSFPQIDNNQGNTATPASANSQPLSSSLAAPTNSTLTPPSPDFALPGLNPANSNLAASSNSGPSVPFNAAQPVDVPKLGEVPKLVSEVSGADSLAQSLIDSVPGGASLPLLDKGAGTLTSSSLAPAGQGSNGSAALPNNSNGAAEAKTTQPTKPFSQAREEALKLAIQGGKLLEALEMMSAYYDSPELGYQEHTDLVDMLDALSREVVYSDRHLLLPPYRVSAQDSLQSLSTKHKLNPEFLAAINKMGASTTVLPNTNLKVLDGPFRAQISLNKGELTLFLRKLYAGRFPVSISQKNRPPVGTYEVIDRRTDRTFYGANVPIAATNPINPYGGFWIGLGGGDFAIHGTPEQESTELKDAGCISLAPIDAADVYRILSKGSVVEIRQ